METNPAASSRHHLGGVVAAKHATLLELKNRPQWRNKLLSLVWVKYHNQWSQIKTFRKTSLVRLSLVRSALSQSTKIYFSQTSMIKCTADCRVNSCVFLNNRSWCEFPDHNLLILYFRLRCLLFLVSHFELTLHNNLQHNPILVLE